MRLHSCGYMDKIEPYSFVVAYTYLSCELYTMCIIVQNKSIMLEGNTNLMYFEMINHTADLDFIYNSLRQIPQNYAQFEFFIFT